MAKQMFIAAAMIVVLGLGISGGYKAYQKVTDLTESRSHAVEKALRGE